VIYRANLSFRLAEKYLKFLLDAGWLRLESTIEGKSRFVITSEGKRIHGALSEIERELDRLFYSFDSRKV
jgi:predicted transcriptional regulator